MYVVRRAFRNYGQMMAPGSIVEPGAVKRFKSRLNDGHIVEVSQQDFEKWQKYFKERIGVTIQLPKVNQEPEKEPEKEPEATKVTAKAATVVVKAH